MSTALSASLGLDAARALDPARYAIGGIAPRIAVRPASWEELADAVRAAAGERLGVVPWGGGVALPREAAPARYDVAVDLGGLDRIVEYEPDDFTITAECGVTLESLRATLAEHGHELPLEAPLGARATLGGVLAANASAARRRALGAPRDRILGARYVLGDGSTARTGGKVVKNVAGYGLHRLLCGSRGGLAILAHASLKLMPAPHRRVALVFAPGRETLADRARWLAVARLEPAALSVLSADAAREAGLGDGAPVALVAGLEDDEARVAELERLLTASLGTPALRREGDAVRALWQSLADLEERPGARLTLTTAETTPAALASLLDLAPGVRFAFHAPAGRLHLWPGPGEMPSLAPILGAGPWLAIDARPAAEFDAAPPPPVAVTGMREALRAAIDPGMRFALGETWVRRAL